ncbi:unnamed protein product [Rhizophagus irregularis]|nr:unnamed protein product [Rhizophagus irregularis]
MDKENIPDYFDTENWTLFGYLCNCKEKGVLETQTIEHRNYLRFLKLLENVPEKKIQAGNAIKHIWGVMPAFSWSGSPDNAEGMNYSTIFGYVMMVRAIMHIWVALPACNYGDPLLTLCGA